MPPRRYSRHTFATATTNEAGELQLYGTAPFGFRELGDTRRHTVKDGDTLHTLAGRYFEGLPNPNELWWIIADFQPSPIQDPTLALEPGQLLYIPSVRTVQEEIFSERRRAESR